MDDSAGFRGEVPVKLVGGAGDDTLAGGAGDDRLEGDEGDDVLARRRRRRPHSGRRGPRRR